MATEPNNLMMGDRQLLDRRLTTEPDLPPLRIHHLLVCAVVAAVLLSLLRIFLSLSPQQQSLARSGIYGFTQVLTSIGLTLTGFSIYWWCKGYASFSQPGQMLLFQFAATFVLYLMNTLFAFTLSGASRTAIPVNWYSSLATFIGIGSFVFGVLLPVAFYGWCAWKVADTGPWRVLFLLCALAAVLTSTLAAVVMQFVTDIGPGNIRFVVAVPPLSRGVPLLAAGALAVATDLLARRNRSWTHWAGVILWLLGQIGAIAIGLYYLFFWRID